MLWKWAGERHTPSEPLPAIFCWWDVSCFFKHRLQNKSHVVSSSAEGNDCGLAGKAASEYGMNVPVKHTTLRCYGPGRALILLLIMPFGAVDSQKTSAHHDRQFKCSPCDKFPPNHGDSLTSWLHCCWSAGVVSVCDEPRPHQTSPSPFYNIWHTCISMRPPLRGSRENVVIVHQHILCDSDRQVICFLMKQLRSWDLCQRLRIGSFIINNNSSNLNAHTGSILHIPLEHIIGPWLSWL